MTKKVKGIPEGYNNLVIYLTIKEAAKAMDFYKKIFGAKEVGRLTMPDGSIAHAELQFGDTRIMMAEENPQWGNQSPQKLGGCPVGLCLYVENVDEVFKQAIAAGCKTDQNMEVKDQFYGDRSGSLIDPFGYKWTIATNIEEVSFEEMQKRMEKMFAEQQ